MESNYTQEELKNLLYMVGRNVTVHKSVIFFNPKKIVIGSNVRIDCFSMISAGDHGIGIENNVHIGAGCYIFGGGGKVYIECYAGLSSRVSLYTATDDYTEGHLSNPTIPDEFKKVKKGSVTVKKHVLIGSGSVIMPSVTLEIGSAVGALTFVNRNVPKGVVVSGSPMRKVATRNLQKLLELETQYEDQTRNSKQAKIPH